MAWHFVVAITGGSPRWQNVQRRLLGIWCLVLGSVIILIGGAMLLAPRQFSPVAPRIEGLVPLAAGALVTGVGIWFCRRQSFRPDLGDVHPMVGKAGGYNAEYIAEHRRAKRTWWTGDPIVDEHPDRDA